MHAESAADDSLSTQLRVWALEQADAAIAAVARSDAEGVHETRKRIKKLRAWRHLLRHDLGKPGALIERLLHDAAHGLTPHRERTVARQSLARLRHGRSFSGEELHCLPPLLPPPDAVALHLDCTRSLQFLQAARVYIVESGFDADARSLLKTVRKSQRRAVRMLDALRDASPCRAQALHDWRKQLKRLDTQLQLLHHLGLKATAAQTPLDLLADLLGLHHDWHRLQLMLMEQRDQIDAGLYPRLQQSLERRQHRLAGMALRRGTEWLEAAR